MFPRRILSSLLCVLCFSAAIPVALAALQGNGWELENFDSKLEAGEALRAILDAAPAKYEKFFEDIGLTKNQDHKIRLKVFPTKEAFKEYQQKNSQSKSDHAYFSLFNSEVVTWNNKNQNDLIQNVLHELTHDRIRLFISDERIPRCLDEGLAEIFEAAQVSGSNISIGPMPQDWRDLLKKGVANSEIKPFSYFLEMAPREFVGYRHVNLEHLHIAQCWAQSQFLYFYKSGEFRPFLKVMLEEGVKPGSLLDLYKKSKISVSYADMEENWTTFLRQI